MRVLRRPWSGGCAAVEIPCPAATALPSACATGRRGGTKRARARHSCRCPALACCSLRPPHVLRATRRRPSGGNLPRRPSSRTNDVLLRLVVLSPGQRPSSPSEGLGRIVTQPLAGGPRPCHGDPALPPATTRTGKSAGTVRSAGTPSTGSGCSPQSSSPSRCAAPLRIRTHRAPTSGVEIAPPVHLWAFAGANAVGHAGNP